MGVKSAPLTIKQDSVLKFGKEGTVNGVMTRCIIAKVTLHYPKKVQEVRFHDRTQAEVQPATQEEEEESVSLLALGESSNFFGGQSWYFVLIRCVCVCVWRGVCPNTKVLLEKHI